MKTSNGNKPSTLALQSLCSSVCAVEGEEEVIHRQSHSSFVSKIVVLIDKTIWSMWKNRTSSAKGKIGDVHTRLMKKNYDEVPQWLFVLILIAIVGLSIFACEGFNNQLQLPWWSVLLACALAFFFTLPVGVIQATTNVKTGLNVIIELVIRYIFPGKPNVLFKTYGYIIMAQALSFLSVFELGHYMKIPPTPMFIVQVWKKSPVCAVEGSRDHAVMVVVGGGGAGEIGFGIIKLIEL